MSLYSTTAKQPRKIAIDPNAHEDPFYRYKMRQLAIVVVGKGKMIRTFVSNVDDVASDLQVDAAYLMHYLSIKLAANGTYNAKFQKQQLLSCSI